MLAQGPGAPAADLTPAYCQVKVGAVQRFAELVQRSEPDAGLAEGALLISSAADPELDPRPSLALLDEFAEGVDGLVSLCRRLFVELGFRGDVRNYHAPVNSLLHRVLQRRRGMPITLSVVTLEVARRAHLQLEAIGMPAHFLVRDPGSGLYVDSFGATVLDDAGCEALFREVNGVGLEVPFGPDARPVVGTREILGRILLNLAQTYRVNAEPRNLEWVMRMRMVIPGVPAAEALQLARAVAAQGRLREAAADLEARAEADPSLAEAFLPVARSLRARLN
jgi:regulator of sirC expression with transglutaminase-like and TPR domain